MGISSIEDLLTYLRKYKSFLYERFGVTSMGVFGSFVRGEASPSSDIDIVVEIEESKRDIHTFLHLKRFLEKAMARKIDLGFESSLKPAIKEKVKKEIIHV